MLNTLPFIPFEKVLQNYVTDDSLKEKKVSKVIDIPKLYMVWVGSLLWRIKQTSDPINPSSGIDIGNKNEYIKSLGGSWKESESFKKEMELNTIIPRKTQDH